MLSDALSSTNVGPSWSADADFWHTILRHNQEHSSEQQYDLHEMLVNAERHSLLTLYPGYSTERSGMTKQGLLHQTEQFEYELDSDADDGLDTLMRQISLQGKAAETVKPQRSKSGKLDKNRKDSSKSRSVHAQRIWKYAEKKANKRIPYHKWQQLIDCNDIEAHQWRAEYNEHCRRRMLKSRLRRRFNDAPSSPDVLNSIERNGFTPEELYRPLKTAKKYVAAMCPKKKHTIQNLICLLRKDLRAHHNETRSLNEIEQDYILKRDREIAKAYYCRYSIAQANHSEADEIIYLIKYLRMILHLRIHDEEAHSAWIRLNEWMQINRRNDAEILWPVYAPQ